MLSRMSRSHSDTLFYKAVGLGRKLCDLPAQHGKPTARSRLGGTWRQ